MKSWIGASGYRLVYVGKHSGHRRPKMEEHILIAEKALGHRLPPKALVHHHDEDRQHNSNLNLVICEGRGYHALIHQRMRVVRAGGDPNNDRICHCCHRLLSIGNDFDKDQKKCKDCRRRIQRKYDAKRRSKRAAELGSGHAI